MWLCDNGHHDTKRLSGYRKSKLDGISFVCYMFTIRPIAERFERLKKAREQPTRYAYCGASLNPRDGAGEFSRYLARIDKELRVQSHAEKPPYTIKGTYCGEEEDERPLLDFYWIVRQWSSSSSSRLQSPVVATITGCSEFPLQRPVLFEKKRGVHCFML